MIVKICFFFFLKICLFLRHSLINLLYMVEKCGVKIKANLFTG